MEPFITLWHFTLPLWFAEKGGFENPHSPEIFARYCAFVVEQLGDLCSHYSTINEFMPYASNGWLRGTWPPFKKWPPMDQAGLEAYANPHNAKTRQRSMFNVFLFLKVLSNLAKAHNAAYDAIKKVRDVEVGIITHVVLFLSNSNPLNKLRARFMNWQFTHRFMNKVSHKCDAIGLNYYFHKKFGDTATYEKTDMGWNVYPEGIYGALLELKRYYKPIYISEAGVADAKDAIRADYIRSLVIGTHRAIEQGVLVKGFMYWSLLDNYELAHGYDKRFGLIEVDFVTQERRIRPSAIVYKEICETNSIAIF
jgi:beta-glucosidase